MLPFKDLGPQDFKALINDDAVLLDVRTPQEVAQGTIEGSIAIDIMNPNFPNQINDLDPDKKYLVFCRSGQRSAQACMYMAQQGFEDLVNLRGGFLAWASTYQ